MKRDSLHEDIIKTVQSFELSGLGVGTSGNASARSDGGFLITPTGVSYAGLEPASLVELGLNGETLSGNLKPSSEWRFHAAIYTARPEVGGIVHVHSPCATALACTRQGIPAFHYLVALGGGEDIPCAEYATFGSEELARNAAAALHGRRACLLANHGMIAVGDTVTAAGCLARQVEELARQYLLSCQAGRPVLLDSEEMRLNLDQLQIYGRQDK